MLPEQLCCEDAIIHAVDNGDCLLCLMQRSADGYWWVKSWLTASRSASLAVYYQFKDYIGSGRPRILSGDSYESRLLACRNLKLMQEKRFQKSRLLLMDQVADLRRRCLESL